MDDALYSRLCQTMRAICLELQARQTPSAALLVEWQIWAKAFVAGLYHRNSAVRAALSARGEADLAELEERATAQLGHAAADLAWAAVRAWAGEHEQAEALAHKARERLGTRPGTAAVAQTLDAAREPHGRSAPGALVRGRWSE